MLRSWREHRSRRFKIYRKRSSLKLIVILGLILAIIYYLNKIR